MPKGKGRHIRRRLDSDSEDEEESSVNVLHVKSQAARSKARVEAKAKIVALSFGDEEESTMKLKDAGVARPDLIEEKEKTKIKFSKKSRDKKQKGKKSKPQTQVSEFGEYTAEKMKLLHQNAISMSTPSSNPPVASIISSSADGDEPDEDYELDLKLARARNARELNIANMNISADVNVGDDYDYIPLDGSSKDKSKSKGSHGHGRLVHEDDDFDEPEVFEGDNGEVLHMSNVLNDVSKSNKRDMAQYSGINSGAQEEMERRRQLEAKMAFHTASEGTELSGDAALSAIGEFVPDVGISSWEATQLRKSNVKMKMKKDEMEMEKEKEKKDVDLLLDLHDEDDYDDYDSNYGTGDRRSVIDAIVAGLQQTLNELCGEEAEAKRYLDSLDSEISKKSKEISEIDADKQKAASEAAYFKQMKAYVIDLLDFLDEKAPKIEELQRKIQDSLLKMWSVHHSKRQSIVNKCIESVVQRGVLESGLFEEYMHMYGSSSDSEIEVEVSATLKDEVDHLFDDAMPEFAEMSRVKGHFEEWKLTYPRRYRDAFIANSIPPVFAPYVRYGLSLWNPCQCESSFETMAWYKELFDYGMQNMDMDKGNGAGDGQEDPDAVLVPVLVERIVVPHINRAISDLWDPYSIPQTQQVISLLNTISIYVEYPQPGAFSLIEACLNRLLNVAKDGSAAIPFVKVGSGDGVQLQHAISFCKSQYSNVMQLLKSAYALWPHVRRARAVRDTDCDTLIEIVMSQLIGQRIVPYIQSIGDASIRAAAMEELFNCIPLEWKVPGSVTFKPHVDVTVTGMLVLKGMLALLDEDDRNKFAHRVM